MSFDIVNLFGVEFRVDGVNSSNSEGVCVFGRNWRA
jgi:hypothetical protein